MAIKYYDIISYSPYRDIEPVIISIHQFGLNWHEMSAPAMPCTRRRKTMPAVMALFTALGAHDLLALLVLIEEMLLLRRAFKNFGEMVVVALARMFHEIINIGGSARRGGGAHVAECQRLAIVAGEARREALSR